MLPCELLRLLRCSNSGGGFLIIFVSLVFARLNDQDFTKKKYSGSARSYNLLVKLKYLGIHFPVRQGWIVSSYESGHWLMVVFRVRAAKGNRVLRCGAHVSMPIFLLSRWILSYRSGGLNGVKSFSTSAFMGFVLAYDRDLKV